MTLRYSISCRLTAFLSFLVFTCLTPATLSSAAEEAADLPINTLSVSFDIARSSMIGTSMITLPPGTGLTLYCGSLHITGTLLEVKGKTPLQLRPTDRNVIRVPESPDEQIVFVSWELAASGMGDNLISGEGITLGGLWHPLPDRDMAYRLEARLPEGFTALSEGDIVTYCLDRLNNRYLTTVFDHPVRSIHFAAGPYTVKSRELPGGIQLSAFFFEEDLALADAYLDKAEAYLAMYQEMIGPYPYNRYSIVENRLPTGYGMPTFTLLGQAVVRLPFITDTSLGHEILHSWFGNSVMTGEAGGNWAEGLTTYLADHYYAEQKGEGWEYRKDQLLRYGSYVHHDNDLTLLEFNNASHSQPLARQVRAVGYDKASMVFHMLRRKLGDDMFFEGLRRFYKQFVFTRAGWDELEDTFAEAAGQDLSEFFDQWLTRWDIPRLDVDFVDISQVEGRSKISFTLRQKNVQPYSFVLPIIVKTRNGEIRESVAVTGQDQEIELLVDTLPVELLLDPDYDVMRELNAIESPPIWSRFMGAEEKFAVLPADENSREIYDPLLPFLEALGCEIVPAGELDNDDLDAGSFLFLGSSRHSLALFADPGHSGEGVTVDVRENPLSPGQAAVLVTSPDREQTERIAGKLSHYGKYSFLYFENGRALEKSTAPAGRGIRARMFTSPKAVRVPDITTLDDIIAEIRDSKVVYVGETHTDLGSHILQLEVIQALHAENPDLAIGMEMFPRSSQEVLDKYIDGAIATERDFIKQSDYFKVWGFDYRYYRDIIAFAHRNGIPLVALNIDKAIVSKVFQEGDTDALDEEQTETIPRERNLDVPGYRQRLVQAFTAHDQQQFDPDKMGGFIQAQSIWDESMAESIVNYLKANPERRMVVIAGNGHVYKDSAIPPRVARRLDVSQSVLSSINAGTTGLEPGYKVDYLIYTSAVELDPAPKVGVVLETEQLGDDPDRTRLRIVRISPHGKAMEAGVKENDLILSLDNQEVEDIGDMRIILMDKRPGDTVTLRVLRERVLLQDEVLDLEVELSVPMQFGGRPPGHPK